MDIVGEDGPVEAGLPPPVRLWKEVVLEWVFVDEVLDDLGGGGFDGCLDVLEYVLNVEFAISVESGVVDYPDQ